MRLLFESLGIDRFGSPETRNAWRFAHHACSYSEVAVVVPEVSAERARRDLPEARVISVPYETPQLPFNRALQYTYRMYATRAVAQVIQSGFTPDVVHRLNPFAIRHQSAFAAWPARLILGPLGGSVLPPGFARARDIGVRILKHADIARINVPLGGLRATYDSADTILCSTRALQERLPSRYHPRVQLLCEGVDCDDFVASPFARDSRKLVFAGRLVPFKGLDHLFRALRMVEDLDWELRVIGDGPLRPHLKQLADELGVGGRVSWLGWLDKEDVLREYADSRFICSPGINESTGNVVMEAMASGRAILVADWAGPGELVPENAGIRASVAGGPHGFVRELSVALRRLLGDDELCIHMGEAGRSHALAALDWPLVLARMQGIHLGD